MNLQTIQTPKAAVAHAQNRFMAAAKSTGLNWENEAMFALQAIKKNDYLLRIAENNPWSVTMAMINVAAIGITINPARQLAYLVPRDGEVILDISYRGLIDMAISDGAIHWAKAEIVRQNDKFIYNGPAEKPIHNFNPFDIDRGELIGVYCMAEIASSSTILVEAVKSEEIWKIRDLSLAFTKKKKGPWVTFEDEMVKKVAIKRASKTWPSTPSLDRAIQYLNEDAGEGIEFKNVGDRNITIDGTVVKEPVIPKDEDIPDTIKTYLDHLIQRCIATGLWKNGRDLVSERYKGAFKAWALNKLDEACRMSDKVAS